MASVDDPRPPVESANLFEEPCCDELSLFDLEPYPWELEPSESEAHALPDPEAIEPAAGFVPFADWLDAQASYFRSRHTSAAAWLAGELAHLAGLARGLGCETGWELDGRRVDLDADRLAAKRAEGYEAGWRARGPRPTPGFSFTFGHDA